MYLCVIDVNGGEEHVIGTGESLNEAFRAAAKSMEDLGSDDDDMQDRAIFYRAAELNVARSRSVVHTFVETGVKIKKKM
jgi:hypothetical protein